MELFVDTETSDMIKWKLPDSHVTQPWIVQLGAILSTRDIKYAELNLLIKAYNNVIAPGAFKAHNISVEMTNIGGVDELDVFVTFTQLVEQADLIVCHNTAFDLRMLRLVARRLWLDHLVSLLKEKKSYCTMLTTTDLLKLPKTRGGYKWPKLQELYNYLFGENFSGAHDAMNDVRATRKCYYELTKRSNNEK